MLKCQKCGGTRIKPSSNFCPDCGEISPSFKELLENISSESAEQRFKIILKRIDRIKKKDHGRRFFYSTVAGSSFAKSGRQNRAVLRKILQAAKGIKDTYDRAYAFAIIGSAFAQAGYKKPALKIFLKSINETRQIINSEIKSSSLRTIAIICRELKIVDPEVFIGMLKISAGIKYSRHRYYRYYDHRYNAFNEIISEYLEAGGKDKKVFKTALDLLFMAKMPDQKVCLLSQIALGYARSGKKQKANELLKEALRMAYSTENAGYVSSGLERIAWAYAHSGMFQSAFKIVDQIKHPKQKEEALYDIASAYTRRRMYKKALKIADQIRDPSYKQCVLRDIAIDYAKAGKIAKALALTNKIKDPFYQDQALRYIVYAYIRAGNLDQASKIVHRMSDTYYREFALDALASAGQKAGMPADSLQISKSTSKALKKD